MTKKKEADELSWDKECHNAHVALLKHEALIHTAFELANDWWGNGSCSTLGEESDDAYAIRKSILVQSYATNLIRCHIESLRHRDGE